MAPADPAVQGPTEALRATVEEYLRGGISAPVALMRLLLSGRPAAAVAEGIERCGPDGSAAGRLAALVELARGQRGNLALVERMVEAGADHRPAASAEAGIAASRAMFDRLVRISPEASVAAYSLGDPVLLEAATREVVDWLRGLGLLDGRPEVLDLGCGIGRLAAALAPRAAGVLGLDVSPGMIDAARARCPAVPGLRFAVCSGRDLAGQGDASCDLVLAVDVFPYLVQADLALAELHVAEAARVLRPGGSLAILNFSYRGEEADRSDLARVAVQTGFSVLRDGVRDLSLWDGLAFWLRRF